MEYEFMKTDTASVKPAKRKYQRKPKLMLEPKPISNPDAVLTCVGFDVEPKGEQWEISTSGPDSIFESVSEWHAEAVCKGGKRLWRLSVRI